MKKCKKLLSSILVLTLIATLFSGVGNIFSGAETLPELKKTINLGSYDSETANAELEKDWTNSSNVMNLTANPQHDVMVGTENKTDLFKDYKLEVTTTDCTYPKKGGQLYVDWNTNTVESVSYTILPRMYLGNNNMFYYATYIPYDEGKSLAYGFRSTDESSASANGLYFRGTALTGDLWPKSTISYYSGDGNTKILNKDTINTLFGVNAIAAATEITITLNYTKTDGKYYLKSITGKVNVDKTVSNVADGSLTVKKATYGSSDFTFAINATKTIEISKPQLYLPYGDCRTAYTGQEAFFSHTYIKDVSITYYESPDNYIPEFVAAYEKISDLTEETVTLENKNDVVECYNIYNGYDATKQGYVGTARYEHVLALYSKVMEEQISADVAPFTEGYQQVKGLTVESEDLLSYKDQLEALVKLYNGYDEAHQSAIATEYAHVYELYSKVTYVDTADNVKTGALNKGQLSNKTASEQMWQYTCLQDYNKYVFSNTISHPNVAYARYFNTSDIGGFGFKFDGQTATQSITGKIFKPDSPSSENTWMTTITSGFINYVKKDFVPANVSNVSATFSLHPGSYNIFFGENTNSTLTAYTNFKYNDGTSEENDFPRYGIRINVKEDGSVSAYYLYVSILDGNADGANKVFKDKYVTCLRTAGINLLYYSSDVLSSKLNMNADKLTISLDLSYKTDYTLDGNVYKNCIRPVITLKDSKGTVISQVSNVNTGLSTKPYLNQVPHISTITTLPTDVTGFAVSSYNSKYDASDTTGGTNGYVKEGYKDTATLYDFDIVGSATPNTYGASIKKTNEVEKQDIRFGISFGTENSYLTSNGYAVKEYGAIVAINNALEDGDSLTLDSQYQSKYSSLGAPKIITKTGSLPEGTVYVNIGNSANDPAILGLVYRVRPYVVYAKDGAEDIVVYSEDSSASNAYKPRSIFTTSKLIANDIIANSGFVAKETYDVNGTAISYSDILEVINGTNTGKSTAKFDGTEITLGQAMIAFTAAHKDLIG